MISFLRGILAEERQESIVMDVHGVGYECLLHTRALSRLPREGQEFIVHTYFQVLENEFKLYGFLEKEELALFKKLISISGIGARNALNIIGAMEPAAFYQAILSSDEKALTRIPGIGKKNAQRLIFELKSRLDQEGGAVPVASTGDDNVLQDTIEALEALGYTRSEVFADLMEIKKQEGLSPDAAVNIKRLLQLKARQMKK